MLPCLLGASAFCLLSYPLALSIGWGGFRHGYWTYNAGLASLSWFDAGFARRELEGTLIRLFTADPMVGAAWFHVLSYAALAALGVWACCQPRLSLERRLALSVTLLAVLARLGTDVGRTDAAVMVCGLFAARAAREARWAMCAGTLFAALLFHEAGLIVLGPLVCVVALASGSWRSWRTPSAFAGAVIMAAAVVAYALSFKTHADVAAIVARLHRQMIEPEQADLAVSVNLTGFKGLAASLCVNRANPIYSLRIICGLVLCPMFAYGLQRERLGLALIASLPAFLLLSLIASDVGRWATMAVFCAFALGAVLPEGTKAFRPIALLSALLASLLLSAFLRLSDVAPVIPLVDYTVSAGGVDWGKAYAACYPEWRADLGL